MARIAALEPRKASRPTVPADATVKGCMKWLMLGALALLVSLQSAAAENAIVTDSWSTLRSGPSRSASPLGLVFGNDRLPVVRQVHDWVAVRLSRGREAWLPATSVEIQDSAANAVVAVRNPIVRGTAPMARTPSAPRNPIGVPLELRPQTLERAHALQSRGKAIEAREELTQLLLQRPRDTVLYEAVRRMSYYHPIGEFAPIGNVRAARLAMPRARASVVPVLAAEGQARLKEGRLVEAVAVLEPALAAQPDSEETLAALRQALQRYLAQQTPKAQDEEYALMKELNSLYGSNPMPQPDPVRLAKRR